jgi:hypothetical protein
MPEIPAVSSVPSIGTSPIPLFVSRPESLLFFWVQLHELEQLVRVERPFSLAVAAATTGYALGVVPLLYDAIHALDDLSKVTANDMVWHIVYCMTFALSVGISVITWGNAFRGKSDARNLLVEIKRRPQTPMAPTA